MTIPTITSISPTAGHTGGRTLVEITGTGFALPNVPASTGPTSPVAPSVSVTIGGSPALAVWVISSTLIRALTPIHDPSGVRSRAKPDDSDLPASDVVVQNLDANGDPIAGETVTLSAAYSFQRPLLDASTYTERAIDALIEELKRQVHPNVVYDPHTDYDDDTGDALNLIELAYLPGIGLTQLRLPTSRDVADRERPEVDLGNGMVAVRRQPLVRDAILTCICASDNKRELLALEGALASVARKNPTLYVSDPLGGTLEYALDYARGEPVTFTERASNVAYFTSEWAIRRIVEPDMPGITTAGPSSIGAFGAHEATTEIVYKVASTNVSGGGL